MFKALVFPRLTQWSNRMVLEAGPLITEVPSVANGDMTEDPFSVTYDLNPSGVWYDGTPITCADVAFTWAAMLDTTGTRYVPGYDLSGDVPPLRAVRCPQPRTVRLEFARVFVPWPNLFGGADGFIIEKSVFANAPGFPNRPDLKDAFQDSIPFSGGPWLLIRWEADQAVFVRNAHYWDRRPYIDQATFVPRQTADQEFALRRRDVGVIFQPAPTATSSSTVGSDSALGVATGPDETVEALWFNLDDTLLGRSFIRQALAFAFDRDAVAQGVPGLIDPNSKRNDCGPWIPGRGPWCAAPGPFAADTYNAARSMALLERAGYDCSDVADGGLCTKNGEPITVTLSTTIGDVGRATAVSLLETSALAAGIDVQIRTYPSSELFSDLLPEGRFQIALYGGDTGAWPSGSYPGDPSVSSMFASNQIPTRANGYGGGNVVRWRNGHADALMRRSDIELDQDRRAADIQAIGRLLAQDLPMLPLYSAPSLAAWQSDSIAGVDPNDVSSPYGFFFGMNRWYFPG
jgi:peptide/nickel transport system substrate-binding protein